MGFLRFTPNYKSLNQLSIHLSPSIEINRDKFETLIDDFGYTKTSIVTSSGEYSVRGYIIDIFPLNYANPVRIELFGNNIENIKIFNSETQLSISPLETIEILPYKEIVNKESGSLYDLLDSPIVIKIDSELIKQGNENLKNQIFEYCKDNNLNAEHIFINDYKSILVKEEYSLSSFNKDLNNSTIKSENIENFNGSYNLLNDYIKKNQGGNFYFCLNNHKIAEYLKENLKLAHKTFFINQKINHGFVFQNNFYIVENDIEKNTDSHYYKNPVKIGRKIKGFDDIKKGDYIVHYAHGIGIYNGIITLEKNGLKKDYLLINYYGNDKVYIPVEKISTLYKYSDKDGTKPKINSLNSTAWEKTKQSIKSRIKNISSELLKLYAERSMIKKPRYVHYPEDDVFGAEFSFEATKDQLKCISDIYNDLEKTIPMDRLLCGDVGFGKTEVAFRGIFNTIMNGYQVAYLCPTTILSNQQYESALTRFQNFPINIALVNRFTTQKEFKAILEKLKNGKIDLVFGTHKLFNTKIEYSNLGLLIIDEEQRFGVTHKEKIKELKKNVNVLTLSATPIPRTLKMAMSGLKDLSILDTAPQDRYPVQTYVIAKNDTIIKDAIYKELSRNGQVYYLYNNVQSIEQETNKIHKLVPEARICYDNGKLLKHELEDIIADFIDYKYDILVCTTIIETGIDIPNVNTLIVSDAQNYGLSQLYQLRGRVGRSNKIAYAYLTYNPVKMLTETAVKRLSAIKEFTELGSGYKIAMRDLSIRGAGDLLGSEQAGFIDSVGIELYTKMLEDTINELKGNPIEEENSSDTSLVNVNTHIDEQYVSDESVRIEIHKLINSIVDYKSLINVKSEIEDRFGKIDNNLEIYMYEEWFEKLASKLEIKNIIQNEDRVEVQLPEKISNQINGEKLFLEVYNLSPKFKLRYQFKRINFTLPIKNLPKHYIYYLVDLLQIILTDIA